MDTKNEHWPLLSFKEYEKEINPNPIYQRSSVWDIEQKQILVDSILRKIDIPKIYLRKVNANGFKYEIIDGQQRMTAIWDFLNNRFSLGEEAEDLFIDGKQFLISEASYKDLETEVKVERIHKYTLDVVIISDASEDEIADLFYRLNNGTPLSPAEVRNAMPGEMKSVVKELSTHAFFQKVNFSNKRFQFDQVCAQMMMLELNGGSADTTDKALSRMYSDYQKSVPLKASSGIRSTLNMLNRLIPEKSRLLNRASTINCYVLISYLLKTTKLTPTFEQKFHEWLVKSEPIRRKDTQYRLFMTSSANSRQAIEGRFRYLIAEARQAFTDLDLIELDSKRMFDEEQKIELFGRDNGTCKICSKKVPDYNWHADHVIPWIKGGKTNIQNGQVLCVKCNLRKSDRLW
jgi:hypothetical protein